MPRWLLVISALLLGWGGEAVVCILVAGGDRQGGFEEVDDGAELVGVGGGVARSLTLLPAA